MLTTQVITIICINYTIIIHACKVFSRCAEAFLRIIQIGLALLHKNVPFIKSENSVPFYTKLRTFFVFSMHHCGTNLCFLTFPDMLLGIATAENYNFLKKY